jgi:hypothetical protein
MWILDGAGRNGNGVLLEGKFGPARDRLKRHPLSSPSFQPVKERSHPPQASCGFGGPNCSSRLFRLRGHCKPAAPGVKRDGVMGDTAKGYLSMAGKTRRQQLEKMLAEEPNDAFLRYALAMEYAGEANDSEALRCFQKMFADKIDYVPAYLQAGQILMRLDRPNEARAMFKEGITLAQRVGDAHAAGEMEAFLDTLG